MKPRTKLIRVFARLFDNIDSSKMIVANAGIEDGMIAYSNASLINWTNIVEESLRQGMLDRLVDAAIAEYESAGPELKALLAAYKEWSERNPMSNEQFADDPRPPIFILTRVLTVLVALALAFLVYWFVIPSRTSLDFINVRLQLHKTNPDLGMVPLLVLKASNTGGRPATLIEDSFRLTFPPDIPIKPQPLRLIAEQSVVTVPRHDEVDVVLKADGLEPIQFSNGWHLRRAEGVRRLPGSTMTLHYRVRESSGLADRTVPIPGERLVELVQRKLTK